ncbi:uncharacterized protein LOC132794525 [Drosophila nasuta]|uniref:uncharacterized protein LOC132794525 n=1 Tax=Drosophila nasuta TaxID=42062 RepID=UPI00295E3A7C|nr:uncharacterized protein LOC132794525 [Drosophila nasuta]
MRSGRVSDSQMGGVANGGHLLGLIAFAPSTWATATTFTMGKQQPQITLIQQQHQQQQRQTCPWSTAP